MEVTERRWTTLAAAQAAGVSYRQLDYWDRIGVLVPFQPARGSGSQRLYTDIDVRVAAVLGYLSSHGATSRVWRSVADVLRYDQEAWASVLIVTGDGEVTVTTTPAAAMTEEGLVVCWVVNPAAISTGAT